LLPETIWQYCLLLRMIPGEVVAYTLTEKVEKFIILVSINTDNKKGIVNHYLFSREPWKV